MHVKVVLKLKQKHIRIQKLLRKNILKRAKSGMLNLLMRAGRSAIINLGVGPQHLKEKLGSNAIKTPHHTWTNFFFVRSRSK